MSGGVQQRQISLAEFNKKFGIQTPQDEGGDKGGGTSAAGGTSQTPAPGSDTSVFTSPSQSATIDQGDEKQGGSKPASDDSKQMVSIFDAYASKDNIGKSDSKITREETGISQGDYKDNSGSILSKLSNNATFQKAAGALDLNKYVSDIGNQVKGKFAEALSKFTGINYTAQTDIKSQGEAQNAVNQIDAQVNSGIQNIITDLNSQASQSIDSFLADAIKQAEAEISSSETGNAEAAKGADAQQGDGITAGEIKRNGKSMEREVDGQKTEVVKYNNNYYVSNDNFQSNFKQVDISTDSAMSKKTFISPELKNDIQDLCKLSGGQEVKDGDTTSGVKVNGKEYTVKNDASTISKMAQAARNNSAEMTKSLNSGLQSAQMDAGVGTSYNLDNISGADGAAKAQEGKLNEAKSDQTIADEAAAEVPEDVEVETPETAEQPTLPEGGPSAEDMKAGNDMARSWKTEGGKANDVAKAAVGEDGKITAKTAKEVIGKTIDNMPGLSDDQKALAKADKQLESDVITGNPSIFDKKGNVYADADINKLDFPGTDVIKKKYQTPTQETPEGGGDLQSVRGGSQPPEAPKTLSQDQVAAEIKSGPKYQQANNLINTHSAGRSEAAKATADLNKALQADVNDPVNQGVASAADIDTPNINDFIKNFDANYGVASGSEPASEAPAQEPPVGEGVKPQGGSNPAPVVSPKAGQTPEASPTELPKGDTTVEKQSPTDPAPVEAKGKGYNNLAAAFKELRDDITQADNNFKSADKSDQLDIQRKGNEARQKRFNMSSFQNDSNTQKLIKAQLGEPQPGKTGKIKTDDGSIITVVCPKNTSQLQEPKWLIRDVQVA